MKALLWLVVVCVMFLYPVLVYFGLQQFGPKLLASLLALVLVVRTSLTWGKADFKGRAFSVLAVLYCLCIVLLNSVILLKYYPVLMSLTMAGVFLFSLVEGQPLIEKLARLSGKKITPRAVGYLRKLTWLWFFVILFNAAVAAYTACCSSMEMWAAYNGALSYGVFALLFAGEWVFRQFYIRRYEGEDEGTTVNNELR